MANHAITYLIQTDKPHRSNKEIAKRIENEKKLNSDEIKIKKIVAPDWLSEEAKKEFIKTMKYLKSINLATKLDINSLGVYADSVVKYANFEDEINKLKELLNECEDIENTLEKIKAKERIFKLIEKLTTKKLQLGDAIRKYSIEFGLTAQSRTRLAIPREKEKEKSEEEEMFANV